MEMCGVFSVIPDGACSTDWDMKYFFTENPIHRVTVCINILL